MISLPFTLRQLDVFSALCATRSFRRAAERLGISQASVSNQVKALEEQLGVTLLLRQKGKKPTLTAEGLAFLDDLDSFNAAAHRLAAYRRLGKRHQNRLHLRIRIGEGLMDNFIHPRLNGFLGEHPDISLQFDAQPPSGTLRDIVSGQYDFALLHHRSDHPIDPEFRTIALLRGGIYGHRKFAAGHELPLRAERVSELPFILPARGSPQEQQVHLSLNHKGIVPRTVIGHTQYFDVMASMLAQGLGVASFAEVILPQDMRETVILLPPLHNWVLIWYRREHTGDDRKDTVERFLLSSLLDDPNYPTITAPDAPAH